METGRGKVICSRKCGAGIGTQSPLSRPALFSLKCEAVWVTGCFPGFLLVILQFSPCRGSPPCPILGIHSSSIPACWNLATSLGELFTGFPSTAKQFSSHKDSNSIPFSPANWGTESELLQHWKLNLVVSEVFLIFDTTIPDEMSCTAHRKPAI